MLALLAAGAAERSVAANSGERLRLRYGGDRDFPPFEFLDEHGKPRGFQIDLLRELAAAGGFDVTITLDDWPKTERAFRAGDLDLIAMSQTRSRSEWVTFARSHATPVFAVYYRDGQAMPTNIGALAGHSIAVPVSEAMRETVRNYFSSPRFTIVEVGSPVDALTAVRDGRVEYALMPRTFGNRAMAAGEIAGVSPARFQLELQAYAFALAPGNAPLLERLNGALEALEANGRLEALRTHWLESHRVFREREAAESRAARQRLIGGGALLAAGATIALLAGHARRRARVAAFESARREATERQLAVAEERLNRAFMAHPDCMAITEQDSTRIVEINSALCRLLGRSRDELLGQALTSLEDILDPAAVETLRSIRAAEGRLDGAPLAIRTTSGELRDCLITSEPIELSGEPCVLSIVRDVTEQVRADAELREGYARLRTEELERVTQLERTKVELTETRATLDTISRAASHDLRPPIRAIRGLASLLRQDIQAGRLLEASGYLDRIDRAARRMDAMVQSFADLVAIDRAPPRTEVVDMTEQAREAWEIVCAAEPKRAVRFRLAMLPSARGDPAMLAQVWQNLLGNAFKYTGHTAEPSVAVESFVEAGRTWYLVADNGAGFDAQAATGLFEAFRRMHKESEFPGTGVGLSIVRRIVRRHGGDIRVRSAPGVGAVFEFCVAPPAAVIAQPEGSPMARAGAPDVLPDKQTPSASAARESKSSEA
jgi:PAS domain S-box-containing protein